MRGLDRTPNQYSEFQLSIKRSVLHHWNSSGKDIVQWLVVDGAGNVQYTARTKENAQRFINNSL